MLNTKKLYSTLQFNKSKYFNHNLQQLIKHVGPVAGHYVHVWDQILMDDLQSLIQQSGKPDFIFSDAYSFYDTAGLVKFVGSAFFAEREIQTYKNANYTSHYQTDHTFNFSCNKKQINRYLLIKLVEMFELKNYSYTWSGAGKTFDLNTIIKELDHIGFDDQQFRSDLLSGIQRIQPLWIDYPSTGKVDPKVTSSVFPYGTRLWTWNNGLNSMYERSAISLIGESVQYEKAAIFTEKTMYAIMGCTIPIWVGGYQQASEWKRIGFDIFEDIVDHSYENYDTLFERCYYAFKKNLHLLTNLDLLSDIRKSVLNRLLENKMNFLEIVTNFNRSVLKQTPDEFQELFEQNLADFFTNPRD